MRQNRFISEEEFKGMQQRVGIGKYTTTECIVSDVRTTAHSPRFNGYRSKLELSWANYLQGLWMLKAVSSWWYEPLNLRLPGKKNFYKPDFLVQTESGLTFYEVKGRNKSDDRSLVKMKTAAGLTPWAKFVLVKRIKGQWEERHIA